MHRYEATVALSKPEREDVSDILAEEVSSSMYVMYKFVYQHDVQIRVYTTSVPIIYNQLCLAWLHAQDASLIKQLHQGHT